MISKKELLRETGISYGQLYRWKRERLIPEEWFIKQSAVTGQETFFERDRILKRVSAILSAKDSYSLPELAEMFSADFGEFFIRGNDISKIGEIAKELAEYIASEGKALSLFEAALCAAATKAAGAAGASPVQLYQKSVSADRGGFEEKLTFQIAQINGEYCAFFLKTGSEVFFESGVKIVFSENMTEAVNFIKLKYNELLFREEK